MSFAQFQLVWGGWLVGWLVGFKQFSYLCFLGLKEKSQTSIVSNQSIEQV